VFRESFLKLEKLFEGFIAPISKYKAFLNTKDFVLSHLTTRWQHQAIFQANRKSLYLGEKGAWEFEKDARSFCSILCIVMTFFSFSFWIYPLIMTFKVFVHREAEIQSFN
jgi:hypothetical protein